MSTDTPTPAAAEFDRAYQILERVAERLRTERVPLDELERLLEQAAVARDACLRRIEAVNAILMGASPGSRSR